MLVARAFGVKVHEFFIGLPGPHLSFTAKGTRYGVTAILFGGYVRIAGMEGDTQDPLLEPVLCPAAAAPEIGRPALRRIPSR